MSGFKKYPLYNEMKEGGRRQQRVIPEVVQVGKILLWLKDFGFSETDYFHLSFQPLPNQACFHHLLIQNHLLITFYTSVAVIDAEDTR